MSERPSHIVRTAREVADILGCQTESISRWANKEGMPGRVKQGWDLKLILPWWLEKRYFPREAKRRRHEFIPEDKALTVSDQKRLLEIEQLKLTIAERRGDLMPLSLLSDLFDRLSLVLQSAGEILARQFGADAQGVLNDVLHELEHEVSDNFGQQDDRRTTA